MKLLKYIAVSIFTGANAATIILMWLCCGMTYLHPADFPRAGLLGLCFPAFLAVDLAFIVFWLVFRARRVWLPLLGLAGCLSFVRDYLPVNLPSPAPRGTLNIITYNTHCLGCGMATEEDGSNAIVNYLARSGADIICLQEMLTTSATETKYTKQMKDNGYSVARTKGEAIFSRLPIIRMDTLNLPTRMNGGLVAWLRYDNDTIVVVNYHFESDHLTPEVKAAYKRAIMNPEGDSLREEIKPLIQLLSEAAPLRAAQVDSISALIEQNHSHPIIVCGDFNDTPISYGHRVLTKHLASAFRESGNGLGFTFKEHGFPVRIDHILYSDSVWRSFATRVDTQIDFSDHFPVVTHLMRR